jgi:hypothetical protein
MTSRLGVLGVPSSAAALRTPADEPSGVLDSMGVAHLVDLPGTEPRLASFGGRRPMLPPDHVVFVGHNDNPGPDEDALVALGSPQFRVDAVRADPAGTAKAALAAAREAAGRFVVHLVPRPQGAGRCPQSTSSASTSCRSPTSRSTPAG